MSPAATRTFFRRLGAAVAVATLAVLGVVAAPMSASAATFTVNTATDASLRAAVVSANGAPGSTINITATGTITLTSTITITQGVTINGPGLANLTITKSGNFDLFDVDMGAANQDVSLSGITFDGDGQNSRGFDLLNNTAVRNFTVTNSLFTDFDLLNPNYGGAINVRELSGNFASVNTDYTNNNGTYEGVSLALSNITGTVSVSDGLFDGNTGDGGSGLYASATGAISVTNTVFSNNTTSNAGAAMYITGVDSVSITGSTFSNENAGNRGGAVYMVDVAFAVDIDSSTFSGNSSASNGGALYVENAGSLSLTGSTFTVNDAVGNGGGLYLTDSGLAAIGSNSFSQGDAGTAGGGIAFGTLEDDVDLQLNSFDQNTAGNNGGAISFGTVDQGVFIQSSSFTNGATLGVGAAIATGPVIAGGQVAIFGDTFAGNVAPSSFTSGPTSISVTSIDNDTAVVIANSTFFETDPAANYLVGIGAIFTDGDPATDDGAFVIASSTMTGNGILVIDSNEGFALAEDNIFDSLGAQAFTTTATLPVLTEYNIFTGPLDAVNMDAGPGNQFDTDPLLGALASNGGPTQTMLPLAGSPAINTGDPGYALFVSGDQRGGAYVRVSGGRVDIGAVELQTLALAATGTDINPFVPIGGAALLLLGAAALFFSRRRRLIQD